MNKVKFDYSRTSDVISKEEVCYMQKLTEDAKKVLLERTGGGNDYLGWIDLPVDYDKEEFGRIKEAAKKIQADSDVLVAVSYTHLFGFVTAGVDNAAHVGGLCAGFLLGILLYRKEKAQKHH